ncbi:MAG: SGNH/GDSL hydrolase family protein [Pontiella sp.]
MKNKYKFRIIAVLLGCFLISIVGASAKSDKKLGLHTGGGRWGFRPAKQYHDGRPRILLIGDSVCSQYSKLVVRELEDTADVDVWVTGKHLNSSGLHGLLTEALEQGKYNVVHFNIGLHGWSDGRIPKGQYQPLLKAYVDVLKEKEPEAVLIWASTTSISESKENPRVLDPVHNLTIVERNTIAAKVMKQEGVAINDLYGLMAHYPELKADRFHWKSAGSAKMTEAISQKIRSALSKESKPFDSEKNQISSSLR